MTSTAVRFISGTKKSPLGSLRLQLRIKPGASKTREGVIAVTPDAVELCVAAQPRDGEANKAVVRLLSDVLGVPRASVWLSHGLKSRDKTMVVGDVMGDGEAYVETVLDLLRHRAAG